MPIATLPLLLAASASSVSPLPAHTAHQFHQDHVLGTSLDAAVVGVDADIADRAFTAMRAEIDRLDAVLSGWREDSELARLNASTGPLRVSEDLFAVIQACEDWRAACEGAFSARQGRVEALWREAAANGVVPSPHTLAQAARSAERAEVRLDPATRTITRPAEVVFAVDALAKGYVIDRALEAGRRAAPEARGLMLDIGGDLRALGEGPAGDWRIGLAEASAADNAIPAQALRIAGRAVATSGAGARDRRVGGRAYSHITSPVDGSAVETPTTTVLADTAADADALATALAVLPPDRGLALASARGAQAQILMSDGQARTTPGWQDLVFRPVSAHALRIPTAAAAAGWPTGFGVRVDFNILGPQGGGFRARAPYVVIWVTDAQGGLVRTLAHYGVKSRFFEENFIWWRSFSAGANWDLLSSVTRPSRAPGAYSIAWDGRDDAGRPVARGRYTIHIEASREHGPHSHQSVTLDLGAAPTGGAAPANVELGDATVRYGAGL